MNREQPETINREDAATYLPFVRKIAGRIARRLPRNVEIDDLMSAGTVGLMEALDRYDANGGRSFETYAEFRVKGAILDELRRFDPLNRAMRTQQSKILNAQKSLTNEFGRPPEVEELAAAMNTSVEVYMDKMSAIEGLRIVSMDQEAMQTMSPGLNQEDALVHKEMVDLVKKGVTQLSQRQQIVLALYYVEDLNQAQIGQVIGVSESRVCQILSEAVQRVRSIARKQTE